MKQKHFIVFTLVGLISCRPLVLGVNALSPGSIFNYQDPEFLSRLKSNIPLNRLANVDEYKGAIQFLTSDSSSYMTGHNLIIDGGRSTW